MPITFFWSSTPNTSRPPAVLAKATRVLRKFRGDDRFLLNSRVLLSGDWRICSIAEGIWFTCRVYRLKAEGNLSMMPTTVSSFPGFIP
jgi:hypothetical protein